MQDSGSFTEAPRTQFESRNSKIKFQEYFRIASRTQIHELSPMLLLHGVT